MKNALSRRVFMEKLAGCTAGGVAFNRMLEGRPSAQSAPSQGALNAGSNNLDSAKPRALINPNILVIMVDQLRVPMWLSSTQLAQVYSTFLPNIAGRIRNCSYSFQQYYPAATVCTASRSTLLTGLYAPQTAVYVGQEGGTAVGT